MLLLGIRAAINILTLNSFRHYCLLRAPRIKFSYHYSSLVMTCCSLLGIKLSILRRLLTQQTLICKPVVPIWVFKKYAADIRGSGRVVYSPVMHVSEHTRNTA